ncbi:MAG: acetate--CoA ligase family protein, partial [Ilumatobacteraceae bacterium]|nr:acetate--CoA ligase family protein [Ilumatobacteraceae bacterium]
MSTLSEFASKEILARHGLPILQERVVSSSAEVAEVLAQMSLPVVAKLCGPSIAHKTERGLVKLNLQTNDDVSKAVDELLAAAVPADGEVEVLIAPMVKSSREFIAGVVRDAQFGPNVMLGVGGVLAEAIADVVFRPVPLSSHDAHEMVAELRSQKLLEEFRGEPAVSIDALVSVLLALSNVSVERSDIASIDLNPLLVTSTGEVVAVDALVEIEDAFTTPTNQTIASSVLDDEHFRALFEPKGVVVTGASSHPGKFGFVSVHNILASGYSGAVFGT